MSHTAPPRGFGPDRIWLSVSGISLSGIQSTEFCAGITVPWKHRLLLAYFSVSVHVSGGGSPDTMRLKRIAGGGATTLMGPAGTVMASGIGSQDVRGLTLKPSDHIDFTEPNGCRYELEYDADHASDELENAALTILVEPTENVNT